MKPPAGFILFAFTMSAPALAAAPVAQLNTFQHILGPVQTPGGVGHACVLYDPDAPGAAVNGPYRMWYRGYADHTLWGDDWIEHAWSHDGANFHTRQLVHTADPRGDVIAGYHRTGYPVVCEEAGGYRLYHSRYYFDPPIHNEWAGCAEISRTSADGISYAAHIEHAVDPLYLVGGWDNYIVEPGSLLKEGSDFILYYIATGDPYTQVGNSIGRAVSADGLTWPTAQGPARQQVLPNGGPGAWDGGVGRPSVVHRGTGPEGYWMFYAASGPAGESIGFAAGADGIAWAGRMPLFTEHDLSTATGLDVSWVSEPWYFRDPESSQEYLYFAYGLTGGSGSLIGRVIIPEPASALLVLTGLPWLIRRKGVRRAKGRKRGE